MAKLKSDVFISGGGPVGLMLAIGLANQGKTVTLAERFLPELSYSSDLNKVKNSFDGRVLALSKGSQTCLQDLEIWSQLEPFTTPIEHIHVSQKGYLGITTLHADEVDVDALGFSVQSSYLGKVLWDIASQKENIRLLAPAQLHSFVESKNHVDIKVKEQDDSITKIKAQLIVGADGTQSKVREILGLEIKEKSYDAYGVLAKIETEQHPQGWAYERFTSEGPVALLPMQGHAHKAVLVCSDQQVEKIKSLDDAEYLELFASKMGERLGRFVKVSPRIVYPLKETYVPQMTKGRAILMGNASHTQHPVAAQGLNLGIRDIEVFIEFVNEMDDLGNIDMLQNYADSRESDHQKVMGMTDSLIQIFQHHSPVVGHFRGIGLMAMQAMPSVKRRFSKFAMRGSRT